jgi:hypothetical protein
MRLSTILVVATMLAMIGAACSSEDATDVRIELSNPVPGFDSMGPFVASGGSAEDGVICATGEGSLVAVQDTSDGGLLADYDFICDDVGGSFTLQLQLPQEIVADATVWDAAVSGILDINTPWIVLTGEGNYEDMEGDGMSGWRALEAGKGPDTGGGVFNVFEGDVRTTG